jgi:hypothetical protein
LRLIKTAKRSLFELRQDRKGGTIQDSFAAIRVSRGQSLRTPRSLRLIKTANRVIGIISHVAELRERIDKQVRVEKTTRGSKIRVVV